MKNLSEEISRVNDLSPHIVTNEWSRFTSKIWVLGVSNVGHENILEENHRSDVVD
jgi:hypothetical protein